MNSSIQYSQTQDGWTIVKKTADETVNNSVTGQLDNELFFTPLANVTYEIELFIKYTSSTVADIKISLDLVNSTMETCEGYIAYRNATGTSTLSACTMGSFSCVGLGAPKSYFTARFIGHSAAGTAFEVWWCQNAQEVSDTKVLSGSYLKYRALT